MNLAVHSRLLSFGRTEGGVETVLSVLRQAVGPTGTLVFPTYTLNLDSGSIFDPANTPSYGMGSLPEYVRALPEARRTRCPLHSHVAIGANAHVVLDADPSRSLGPNSSFDAMHKAGFHLLLLGCTFHEGATFVHHVEAMDGVPYREWIDLERQVLADDGQVEKMKCPYYGRRRDDGCINNLHLCELAAGRRPETRVLAVGKRNSLLVPLGALDDCVRDLLAQDPYALVVRKEDTIHAG